MIAVQLSHQIRKQFRPPSHLNLSHRSYRLLDLLTNANRYSFFKNYDVSCSSPNAPNGRRDCQNQILSIEGDSSTQIYGLSEIGALQMLTIDRQDKASWSDNLSVYSNSIGYISYRV